MKYEIVAGIDLGGSKVSCIIAQNNFEKEELEILGIGEEKTYGMRNGIVVNLEEITYSIKSTVQKAEAQSNVKLQEAYIGISATGVKGEISRGVIPITRPNKEINYEDIKQLIEQAKAIKVQPNQEIIYTIPQEFIVDDQRHIEDPIRMSGNRVEGIIYIIYGNKMTIQNINKAVNEAGLKSRGFILHSIASSYSVLNNEEKEMGCMLIDIGAEITEGVIFYNGYIKEIFSIPIGGFDITNDISIGMGITRNQAEEIKINYGIASLDLASDEFIKIKKGKKEKEIEKKFISSIIAPRVEEVFSLIHRKLRDTEYLDSLPAGITITGGTAKLNGIEEVAEKILGTPAKIGIPNINNNNGIEKIRDPAFASTIGLVMYATKDKNNYKRKMGKITQKGKLTTKVKEWLIE